MGYYVKKLGVTCEDCLSYRNGYCEYIANLKDKITRTEIILKNKLKELNEIPLFTLLDFISKEKSKIDNQRKRIIKERERIIEELQELPNTLERKRKACLDGRAYVAVVKEWDCFIGQEIWEQTGLVSNCKKCYHYLPDYNICACGIEPRNKRGFCSAYAYDIGKEDYEEFYELEGM